MTIRFPAIVSLLLLLLSAPAASQWSDVETGAPAPETAWRQAKDGFGAALVVLDAFDPARSEWVASDGVPLPEIRAPHTIRRGDVVYLSVFFAPTAEVNGPVRPEAGFRVLQPDGAVISELPFATAWRGEPPEAGQISLGSRTIKFFVEPDEPLGEYVFTANCRQNPSSTALALEQRIKVIE